MAPGVSGISRGKRCVPWCVGVLAASSFAKLLYVGLYSVPLPSQTAPSPYINQVSILFIPLPPTGETAETNA